MKKLFSIALCYALLASTAVFGQVATPAGPSTGSVISAIIVSTATAPAAGSACSSYNLEWLNYQTGEGSICLNGVIAPMASRLINTTSNCSATGASPLACSAAPSGSVSLAAGSTSVTVNTTAVTANSQIQVTFDSSLGTRLGITCNTTFAAPYVTARTAGTSFTITVGAAPTTNAACYSYTVIN